MNMGLVAVIRREPRLTEAEWVWLFSGGTMHSRIDHLTRRSLDLGAGSGSGISPSS